MRLAVAFLCMSTAAQAAPQCAEHDKLAAALKGKFGETVQVQGVSNDGRLTEMYANIATGTWTAVMTAANGVACVAAAGRGFKAIPPGQPT